MHILKTSEILLTAVSAGDPGGQGGAGAGAGADRGRDLHVHLRVPVDPGARHRRHAPRHGLQLLHGEH